MKKRILLSLLVGLMLAGCGATETDNTETDNTESNYTQADSDDNENENDDNDENENDDENTYTSPTSFYSHNQGASCLNCHSWSSSSYVGESFLSGGTVYTELHTSETTKVADGYTLRALLDNGTNINLYSGRGTGNSNSENSALSSVYSFTAQVVNASGTVVNSSNANSHQTSTHLDCNRCHTDAGANGAPGRIISTYVSTLPTNTNTTDTNTTVTTTAATFVDDVYPIFVATCSTIGCHSQSSTNNFIVTTDTQTYSNIGAFTSTPAVDSILLAKATNSVVHGGGKVLDTLSNNYLTIRDWMDANATLGTPTAVVPTPTTLSFANDVLPVLTTDCRGCHGNSGAFTITTSTATYANIASFNGINLTTPSNSSLLTKANGVNHGGGLRWSTTHSSYITVKEWITQGALNN